MVALLLLGVLAFANGLHTPFVFDDQHAVVENTTIRQLWPPTAALWNGPPQGAVAGRPIPNISLAANYAFGGLSPTGYHAANLAIHSLAALVLFGIVRRSIARLAPAERSPCVVAFAAAALWLVHPVNTEVVSYVTQRTESLMGLFLFLTLYSAIRVMEAGKAGGEGSENGHRKWWLAAGFVSCAAGMLCKETMVTAPVLVLVYDRAFVAPRFRDALRDRRALYVCLATSWLVLLAVAVANPRSGSAGFSAGVSVWTYLVNQLAMVSTYLRLAVWPRHLVLDYGVPRELPLSSVAVPLAVLAAAGLAIATAWVRGWMAAAFLATWFFVMLAPTSSFVPIATEVGAERRMYVPLAAVTVGAALLLSWIVRTRIVSAPGRQRAVMLGGTAVLISTLVALTIARNREYETPIRIWQTVVERRPHGRAHLNLGIALLESGDRTAARRHFEIALPDAPGAHYPLASEFQADGRYEEAARHYREYLRLQRHDVTTIRARHQLGRVYLAQNHLEAAAAEFRQVLQIQQGHMDALAGLGDTLMQMKHYADAIPVYREYLSRRPDVASAYASLGVALASTGREAEAAIEFERALAIGPPDPAIHQNAAYALAAVGRLDEAVLHLERAVRASPKDARLFSHLGATLTASGRTDRARVAFERAFALAPNDPHVREDYEVATRAARGRMPPR